MRTEKEQGAIRVMDALSAVDGELLARCEEAGTAESGQGRAAAPGRKKGRRKVYRYAMACAAWLCLIVAGAAYYGLGQLRMGSVKRESSGAGAANGGFDAPEASAAEGAAPMGAADGGFDAPEASAAEGAAPMEAADDGYDGVAGGVSGELQFAMREPEWLDLDGLTAEAYAAEKKSYTGATENAAEKDSLGGAGQSSGSGTGQEEMRNPESGSDRGAAQSPEAEVCLKAAREPETDAAVPEGYSLVRAETGTEEPEGRESGLYEWSDGENSLWLKVTRTELTADLRFDVQPPVCTVREAWQDLIPDAGESGFIRFALLYEDGTLAEYCGILGKEEVVRLLESLAP